MSERSMERSLAKGILAGMIAGLVATAAKAVAEKMYGPRGVRESERPTMMEDASSPYRGEEAGREKSAFAEANWGFGLAAGAAYGALAEFYPAAAAGGGKTFGLAMMTLTHESGLPSGEVNEAFDDEPSREATSEAASHLLFGTVAEQVRSYVRGIL
ncbi:MAG: DUF1440 domain-containing protein [Acidobacteria bacterium]|nr:DUF1440 domain-containing protein [Acidobacteriota bacterium]